MTQLQKLESVIRSLVPSSVQTVANQGLPDEIVKVMPLELHHVLIALDKVNNRDKYEYYTSALLDVKCNYMFDYIWDLTKPLHLQPEPVIAFLSSVLVK